MTHIPPRADPISEARPKLIVASVVNRRAGRTFSELAYGNWPVPVLPPLMAGPAAGLGAARRPRVHTEVVIEASMSECMVPGTLKAAAYLAEVRPLIPPAERAWIIVVTLRSQAGLRAGDLRAATLQLQAIHVQVQDRVGADPAGTQ